MIQFEHRRAIRLIQKGIDALKLNLSGFSVLTEVGSNNYLYTPIIAAMAGAKKVYAWTADTSYGTGGSIKENCMALCHAIGVHERVSISVNEKPTEQVEKADIITNSGFLRPLDDRLLDHAHPGVVVPLMYEAWELRSQDIDIDYCRKRNIKVAGTCENHPSLKVFDSTGALAVKMANEAGFEVFGNNIVVWSNDHFGKVSAEAFKRAGASNVMLCHEVTPAFFADFSHVDFIYFCNYKEQVPLFANNGIFDIEKLTSMNESFGIVHLYGDVDNEFLKQHGVRVYPDRPGKPQQMTFTLGYLGLLPIINLQIGGFKVASQMLLDEKSDLMQPITF